MLNKETYSVSRRQRDTNVTSGQRPEPLYKIIWVGFGIRKEHSSPANVERKPNNYDSFDVRHNFQSCTDMGGSKGVCMGVPAESAIFPAESTCTIFPAESAIFVEECNFQCLFPCC
jgi:hypothetical protein